MSEGSFHRGAQAATERVGLPMTFDPSTEQPLASVAKATDVDVDKAVRAARRAQRRSWGQLSGRERAKYLFRISRILQERSREFAVLESMDSGKPIKESRDVDVPGRPYTFGRLQLAQALGDLRALTERGRPVVRLHLTDRAAGTRQLLAAAEATG